MYLDDIADFIYENVGAVDPIFPEGQRLLYRLYALLALTRGIYTSNEDVHNAWSIWQATINEQHPALVLYHELPESVRELDTPYRQAIRQVASWQPQQFFNLPVDEQIGRIIRKER